MFQMTDDPKTMGLLQMAAGLMAAGGPSEKPINFGMGLLSGLDRYSTVLDNAKKMKMAEDEAKARQQRYQWDSEDRAKSQALQQEIAGQLMRIDPSGRMLSAYRLDPKSVAQQLFPSSTLAKIDPKDYTPESFSAYMQTGNPSALRKADDKPADPEIVRLMRANGIQEGSPQWNQILSQYTQKLSTHQPPVSVNMGAPILGVGPDGKQQYMFPNPTKPGNPVPTGITPEPKKATEGENVSAGFADRMLNAEKLLSDIKAGEPTTVTSAASAIPMVGDYARRVVETPEQQKYRNAADDWIRAKLRRESGAVISPSEMAQEYQTYFPQPGDSDAVKKQKAQLREIATEGMVRNAGSTYSQPAQAEGWKSYGYQSKADAIKDGQNAIMKNPLNRAEVIRRLEQMGVKDHGLAR